MLQQVENALRDKRITISKQPDCLHVGPLKIGGFEIRSILIQEKDPHLVFSSQSNASLQDERLQALLKLLPRIKMPLRVSLGVNGAVIWTLYCARTDNQAVECLTLFAKFLRAWEQFQRENNEDELQDFFVWNLPMARTPQETITPLQDTDTETETNNLLKERLKSIESKQESIASKQESTVHEITNLSRLVKISTSIFFVLFFILFSLHNCSCT